MSSNSSSSKVVTVDEQAFEKAGGQTVDEDGFPVVDETPEFRQRSTWKCRRKSIPTILTRGSRKARITCSGKTLEQEGTHRGAGGRVGAHQCRLNSVSRRDARSGREISQRSGALSGVWSSEAGGERESDG